MSVRSNSSRDRLLQTAESLILQQGFAGTSIDHILEKAALTKGGFFYHFKGKAELAKALVQRYLEGDSQIFDGLFVRARSLSEDPLHQLLIFLNLFAEMMNDLEETHPGCLVAGFTYETQQFDDEVRALIKQGVLSWREMITAQLAAIDEVYLPRQETQRETLADMFTAIVEGGIILSRIFQSNDRIRDQILLYRDYLRLLYENNLKPV
ncbi:TetR/AcrR family transcriptional regulator [Marinobacterium lutimaris]|uniref:Transcriptional regulator, TetR family n=1 Tax=Marinobacterium lutimaris TaxID=568106 RepID=A0A1H5X875_9GAMM|nr:TetR/AcrR family transcriptional regulator [Marinobacterium lutimaris]SEG07938.1 transcriptional regulator, TetR family [Marinobacterium lutimaris]